MAAVQFEGTGEFRRVFSADEFDNAPTIFLKKRKLQALIVALSGLKSTSVTWDKDPRPMVSDGDRALLTMSLKSSDYLGGADDRRRYFDLVTSKYTLEITGPRTVVFSMKCEVYDYQLEAYSILERIRTLLNGNLELSSINMCYQTCQLITDLPTTYDNRVVNVAILEVQLGLVSSLIAKEEIGSGWIETVNITDRVPGTWE